MEISSPPRRRLRNWLIASAGVLVLLVAAGWATFSFLGQDRTAQATAEKYFQALADGDATAARDLTTGIDPRLFDTTYLTDDMLGAATERISDVKVTQSDDYLDVLNQKVDVSYTLAGEQHTETLVLVETAPTWGFLQNWKIRQPFVSSLNIDRMALTRPVVAGQQVDHDVANIQLFPGVYPITPEDSELFTSDTSEVVMNGVDDHENVSFTPTPALLTQVQSYVDGLASNCAAATPTSTQPVDGCPFSVVLAQGGDTPGTWEVLEFPTAELGLGGRVYSTSGGSAQFSPSDGGAPTKIIRGIEMSGTIEIDGRRVRLLSSGS